MDATGPRCPRHPGVETRLRCSACDTLICPDCAHEAAVGYKCPDCHAADAGVDAPVPRTQPNGRLRRGSGRRRPRRAAAGAGRLPLAVGTRGTLAGLLAATVGGLLLAPVLLGGAFFLISSGVIGWAVARSVYWATRERNSPYVRAIALTLAGFAVAVALITAGGTAAPAGLVFLAYPAAVYGGWIVVRQR